MNVTVKPPLGIERNGKIYIWQYNANLEIPNIVAEQIERHLFQGRCIVGPVNHPCPEYYNMFSQRFLKRWVGIYYQKKA